MARPISLYGAPFTPGGSEMIKPGITVQVGYGQYVPRKIGGKMAVILRTGFDMIDVEIEGIQYQLSRTDLFLVEGN